MTHASNPIVVICTADIWVKVATGVMTGTVHKLGMLPSLYRQTYRITTQAAPTDDSDAALLFQTAESEEISHDIAIDVYIKAVGKDGLVRVDT